MPVLTALLAAAVPPAATPVAPSTPVILDRGRADRMPAPAPEIARPAAAPANAPAPVHAGPSGTTIRTVRFGAVVVPAVVADAVTPFIGRPATTPVLTDMVKAISAAYARSDVALYAISVPPQSLAGGSVTVAVIESHVEQIRYVGRSTPLLRAYADALVGDRPLKRATMERYISLIRDIPGLTADIRILPGSRPDAVILRIDAKRKRKDATATAPTCTAWRHRPATGSATSPPPT